MDFSPDRCREILQRTPATLRVLLAGLPDDLARARYGPNTWSPHEILAHLIFGEDTDWIPRLRHMLAFQDSRPIPPFDRAGHAALAANHTTAELLDLFAERRRAGLADLAALTAPPGVLDLRGTHPRLGPVTVRNLIATWAAHDLNHITQTAKALAFQFAPHVGAWEAFLSILAPPNPR